MARQELHHREGFGDWFRFILANQHVFKHHPQLVFQQAANEPVSTVPAQMAETRFKAGLEKRVWFALQNKPQARSSCIMTLTGHTKGVTACSFSPDGKLLISAAEDQLIKIWDSASGQEIATLKGHSPGSEDSSFFDIPLTVRCIFSLDGERIATAAMDQKIKVWDSRSGQEIATLEGSNDEVVAMAFLPGGQRLVSVSKNGNICFWDADWGRVVNAIHCEASQGQEITDLVFDNTKFEELHRLLWDDELQQNRPTMQKKSEQGTEYREFIFEKIEACAFSPDFSRLVTSTTDKKIKLCDLNTGKVLETLKECDQGVSALAYSPDGEKILFGTEYGVLSQMDPATRLERVFPKGHSGWINACLFSPEGSRALSASSDRLMKLWDTATGQELRTFSGHMSGIRSCAFSPDGGRVVSASFDETLKLWNAAQGGEAVASKKHSAGITALVFSPDGSRFVSASLDRTLKLWDGDKGKRIATLRGHRDDVLACAFSHAGHRILSASGSALHLWDATTGQKLNSFECPYFLVTSCAFSADDRSIVYGSDSGNVVLFDLNEGREIFVFRGHSNGVNSCVFSPNGRRILSASADHTLRTWDLHSGKNLVTLNGHTDYVVSGSFSHKGKLIVSASGDRTLKLWDAENGQELATLWGHSDGVFFCAFSPGSSHILSASLDQTVKLWRVDSASVIAECYVEGLNAAAWSPHAGLLVVGCKNGDFHIVKIENLVLDPHTI